MYNLSEVKEVFGEDADTSIIEKILYFSGWTSWEDSSTLLIFRGIDGSLQMDEHSSSPYNSEPIIFSPREISQSEADDFISEMEEVRMRMKEIST